MQLLATEPHYFDHLEPLAKALDLPIHTDTRHVNRSRTRPLDALDPDKPTIVTSHKDYLLTSGKVIYAFHGIGQSYIGQDDYGPLAYRDRVILNLCPTHQLTQDLTNLGRETVHVGPMRLDQHLGDKPTWRGSVVFTGHWDNGQIPETRSAYPHFKDEIQRGIETSPAKVLGHHHPRNRRLRNWWHSIGVDQVHDFDTILALRPEVLVADNTSAIYEAAALDISVVLLNSPDYRRDVEHGLRFWQYADVGIQVDDPEDLWVAIDQARQDPQAQRRREITHEMFAPRDEMFGSLGGAVDKAVDALGDI